MDPIQIPNEAEIGEAYDKGKDAVVELFYGAISKFVDRIQKIEDQLVKNSKIAGNRHPVITHLIRLCPNISERDNDEAQAGHRAMKCILSMQCFNKITR